MCSKRYDHIVMPGPASNSDFGVRIHTWWAPASTRSLGILLENLRWWVCLDWAYFCWNWKHCSEIIFKCVNSAMRPIFNKKVVENCNLWDLWTVHVCTVHSWQNQLLRAEPKKKKKRKTQRRNADASFIAIQTGTIYLYVWFYEGRSLENKCIGS